MELKKIIKDLKCEFDNEGESVSPKNKNIGKVSRKLSITVKQSNSQETYDTSIELASQKSFYFLKKEEISSKAHIDDCIKNFNQVTPRSNKSCPGRTKKTSYNTISLLSTNDYNFGSSQKKLPSQDFSNFNFEPKFEDENEVSLALRHQNVKGKLKK